MRARQADGVDDVAHFKARIRPLKATRMSLLAAIAMAAAIQSGAALQNIQTEIEAPGPQGPLRGTLLSPATPNAPMVLIVPGSGGSDRNGDGPGGPQTSTYRLLAEGLLDHGIASVRIDKRGMFGSASAIPDANDVTIDEYASDVHSWIKSIRKRTAASCVWVLGHSEGGLVALKAAQDATGICGLILVSTAGRPLGTVLREQLQSNPAIAPLVPDAMSVLESLEAGQAVEAAKIDPHLMPVFRPQVQRFLMSELTLDPATLLAGYAKPVLIVQGMRDLQVTPQDARLLKHADPGAKLVFIADANHVLKTVRSDDWNENLATYSNPDLPLADNVVETIATFVHASRKDHPTPDTGK